MIITLSDALTQIGVSAYIKDGDYDTIVWTDPKKTVSKEDLEFKVAEMQKAEDAIQYRKDRKTAYPEIGDQLDDLFKQGAFSKEMSDKLQQVKADHPKPE